MVYGKGRLLAGFLCAAFLGVVLHFLYGWWPNGVTAMISPLGESIWEHVKILYWPYLAAALVLTWDRPGALKGWSLVLCLMCGAMLAVGYLVHIVMGYNALWVDLLLYFGLMALGFWVPTKMSGPFRGIRWWLPLVGVVALGILIVVFTLWPGEGLLFADLSAVPSWAELPC